MYRNLILENGKAYTVHDSVADAYETMRANMEEMEKKKDMSKEEEMEMKKKDMDIHEKKEKEGDMSEEEMKKKKDMEEMEMKKKDEEEEKMKFEAKKKKDMEVPEKKEKEADEMENEEEEFLNKKDMKKKDMKKMNSLESQLGAERAKNKALRIKLNSKQAEEEKTDEVRERVSVINSATKILKCDSNDLVEKDSLTIKTEVVNHVFPDMITDGKDETYISAIFDVANEEKGKTYTKIMDNAMDRSDDYFAASSKNKGKKDMNMEEEHLEKRKNAWQDPVSGSYKEEYSKSSSNKNY